MRKTTIQELIRYGVNILAGELKDIFKKDDVYIQLPQYNKPGLSTGFEKSEYALCKEISGGAIIILKCGQEVWTSANCETVIKTMRASSVE